MKISTVLFALAMSQSATGQVQLQFPPTQANYIRVLGGKLFVGSKTVLGLSGQHTQIAVSLFPSGAATTFGGSGNAIALDAKLDASGDIWIVGNTTSDDFPLVNPVTSHKTPARASGFLMEVDPSGTKVVFSTYIAGQPTTLAAALFSATHATVLEIDLAGNVYVGGDTNDPGFPITPGTVVSSAPQIDNNGGGASYSYIVKFSPLGKMVYSTLVRTGFSQCATLDCSDGYSTYATISSLAVDSSGVPTAAGVEGGSHFGVGYISRLSRDATQIVWSASFGDNFDSGPVITGDFPGAVTSVRMAQDANGNLTLFGTYGLFDDPLLYGPGAPGLFLAHFNSGAPQFDSLIDFGLSPDSAVYGIASDGAGRIYLAGTSSAALFPGARAVPNLGADFIYSPGTPSVLFRFPVGVVIAPPSFDPNGNLQVLGAQGSLLTLPPTYIFDSPAIVAIANGASFSTGTGLYPDTFLSIFGFNLPSRPQVSINDTATEVIYSSTTQINVLVPDVLNVYTGSVLSISSPATSVSVSAPPTQSIGIFTTDGTHVAALNQDGSVNSSDNPAAAGSVVSLFGTGFDDTTNTSVNSGRSPLEVTFAGPVVGMPGIYQINVRMPRDSSSLLVQASSRNALILTANPVSVYAR